MPVRAVRFIRLEGAEKGSDLVRVIWAERIEEQMDVDLFLLFIDDIVRPKLNVREEHLG